MLVKFNFNSFKYKYYNNRKEHNRVEGPSLEYCDGSITWFKNNKIHKENGYAVEYGNGEKYYWVERINYGEREYWRIISLKRFGAFI